MSIKIDNWIHCADCKRDYLKVPHRCKGVAATEGRRGHPATPGMVDEALKLMEQRGQAVRDSRNYWRLT